MDLTEIPSDSSRYWLNTKMDVWGELRSMHKHNVLVTLFGGDAFCVTNVISVSKTSILVDKPINSKDEATLSSQRIVHFSAFHEGIPIYMELGSPEDSILDGVPCWKFKMPSNIHKLQRRESFRVYFPGTIRVSSCLDGEARDIRISNLSLTGLGLTIDSGEGLQRGDVRRLMIKLPAFGDLKSSVLEADVIVKHISETTGNRFKLGVSFSEGDRTRELLLSRWQMELQRAALAACQER